MTSLRQPTIWCLLDSRPGHRNQVLGLAEAIARLTDLPIERIDINGVTHGILTGLRFRRSLPDSEPLLLIGAGHSTHMPLLQLAARLGAGSVVLMKPSFPLSLFDVCVVPDVYSFKSPPENLIQTKGVLNRIRPSDSLASDRGLFLIGGPSDHHQWSDSAMIEQLNAVMTKHSDIRWQVATSRRTPASFVKSTGQMGNCEVVTPDDVHADWLPEQLKHCGTVWVSEDSVSMLYEAVTSGAQVGLLELPRTRSNRATQCVDLLLNAGDVTSFREWNQTAALHRSVCSISEADRCALEIQKRGLLNTMPSSGRVAA